MGLTPNLLNENCDSITSWTDTDNGAGAVSSVDPAGQFKFLTATKGLFVFAGRSKTITSPPDKFTIELRTYFDALGTVGNTDCAYIEYSTDTWGFRALFATDGLFIQKAGDAQGEVGTNIVAVTTWAIWRFQVDKSGGEASATVEVFLNDVSQGTVDCDWENEVSSAGLINYVQTAFTTNSRISHVDYIRIATGLGPINDTARPQLNIF